MCSISWEKRNNSLKTSNAMKKKWKFHLWFMTFSDILSTYASFFSIEFTFHECQFAEMTFDNKKKFSQSSCSVACLCVCICECNGKYFSYAIFLFTFFRYLHNLEMRRDFLSPLNPASSSRVHSSPYLQKFFQHVWLFILFSTTLFVSSRHIFHLHTMQSIASKPVNFYQQKIYLQNQFSSTANI